MFSKNIARFAAVMIAAAGVVAVPAASAQAAEIHTVSVQTENRFRCDFDTHRNHLTVWCEGRGKARVSYMCEKRRDRYRGTFTIESRGRHVSRSAKCDRGYEVRNVRINTHRY